MSEGKHCDLENRMVSCVDAYIETGGNGVSVRSAGGDFDVVRLIGKGSWGYVSEIKYQTQNAANTSARWVMKCAYVGVQSALQEEYHRTKAFSHLDFVPRLGELFVVPVGNTAQKCYTMQNVGLSIRHYLRNITTWTQIGSIGAAMIEIAHRFHKQGYFHGDMNVGNFVIGAHNTPRPGQLYLLDMEWAGRLQPLTRHEHVIGDVGKIMSDVVYLYDREAWTWEQIANEYPSKCKNNYFPKQLCRAIENLANVTQSSGLKINYGYLQHCFEQTAREDMQAAGLVAPQSFSGVALGLTY